MLRRLIAFLLIAESIVNGMHVAGLLPALPGHDVSVVVLILARGLVGALQFAGGWTLAKRRPAGAPLARTALLVAAVLTTLDVGLNLAPTPVYYWYRWQFTAAYWAYAVLAAWWLGTSKRAG